MLLTIVSWPAIALTRHYYDQPAAMSRQRAAVRRWARLAVLGNLIVILGWTWLAAQLANGHLGTLSTSFDPWLRCLQFMGLISVAAAIMALWEVKLNWVSARGWWPTLWGIALAGACCSLVWIEFAFKLIRISVDY
jgi:hypothetical protein